VPAGHGAAQLGAVPIVRVADQDQVDLACDFYTLIRIATAGGAFHPNESCGVDLDYVRLSGLSHCALQMLGTSPDAGREPEERQGALNTRAKALLPPRSNC
jgi:hypothetical protein